MDVLDAVKRVQAAAEANATGDPVAHVRLLEEIHRLRLVAETPAEATTRMRLQKWQSICIRLALEFGVLQYIVSKTGNPVTAAELSKQTGADELLIVRIMRLVTYVGGCEELAFATYASNPMTEFLTQEGIIGGEKHHTDLGFTVASKLIEMARTDRIHQFPDNPGEKGPFEYAFGAPMFEYFERDREQKEAFDAYMGARRDAGGPQWFDKYPVERELAEAGPVDAGSVLLVDVGGGKGHELVKFRRRFPDLPGRLVLQDLPITLRGVGLPEGVEVMEHDFFGAQPVKGARFYFLRQIMHDWSDAKCVAILSHIVAAMDPAHSRVLIDEFVMPETGAEERAAAIDILMLMYTGGIERTRRQWEALLASAGLEIVAVHMAATGQEAVIEAKVKG